MGVLKHSFFIATPKQEVAINFGEMLHYKYILQELSRDNKYVE
jgi:hypothetical protein